MKTLARPEDLDDLRRRLQRVRPDSAARWGRMSAHQMICHISDACRMATGQKPVNDAARRMPRTLVRWIALYLPWRWPPGLPTRPEIDQRCDGTRPVDFAADVTELEMLLERMTRQEQGFDWPSHPVFGRMTRAAWLRWAYLHADHHLRQFGA